MNDTGNPDYRSFDPAQEDGAEPPQPRSNSLRDRIRRSAEQSSAPAVSPSGYVHQPQQPVAEMSQPEPEAQPQPAPLEVPRSEDPAERPGPPAAATLGEAPPRPPEPAAAPETGEVPESAQEPEAVGENAGKPIGVVLEIAGSSSQIAIDLQRLNECADDTDPSVAMAGQVGSQIKIRVGNSWLLASVRNQRQDRKAGSILANIDFLGEGTEEKLTGKLHRFRRGVTRYPVPGAMV